MSITPTVDMSLIIILASSLLACLLAVISTILSIYSIIELRSFNKSTHQVQYMPIDPKEQNLEALDNLFNPTTEESLETQRKAYQDDLLEAGILSDEEEGKYSF